MKSEPKDVAMSNTRCVTANLGTVARKAVRERLTGGTAAAIAAGAMGLGLAENQAKGNLMMPGNPQSYLDEGSSLQGGALSFKALVPGVGTGERNSSSGLLNPFQAVTAKHNLEDLLVFNPSIEIADGLNYITDRGTVISVDSFVLHPTLDLAILNFATPLDGAGYASIGSIEVGDVIKAGGYGSSAYLGDTSTFRDGNLRGWQMQVLSAGTNEGEMLLKFSSTSLIDNHGKGLSGDSGGPVYHDGYLVGIMLKQTGDLGPAGTNSMLHFGYSEASSWLAANYIPEPGFALILSGAALGLLRRSPRYAGMN